MSSCNRLLTLALLALIIVACSTADSSTRVHRPDEGSVYAQVSDPPTGYGMFRVHDPELDVYCWIYESRGGIDCIPGKDLR